MLAIDTETTGVDLYHGCSPFFIGVCDDKGTINYWEWDVDPITREVQVVVKDLEQFAKIVNKHDKLVFQNAKFDIRGICKLGCKWRDVFARTEDTLIMSHVLASGEPHNLTYLALRYLKIDIAPLEEALTTAVKKARTLARTHPKIKKEWKLAKEDDSSMPSAKSELHKFDMWLPRAVAKVLDYPPNHPWWSVLRDYNIGDISVTIALYPVMMELLERRDLVPVYQEQRKLIQVVSSMEAIGITYSNVRKTTIYNQYKQEAQEAEAKCLNLANRGEHRLDKLPKGGSSSKQLQAVLFDYFGLKSNKLTKKAKQPSTDAKVMEYWAQTLPSNKPASHFVRSLMAVRQRATAIAYMDSYDKASLTMRSADSEWRLLHPSLNQTGTATLRFSSQNPNEQNISRKPGFNLRYCFGPLPDREWWSFDYENLELRLPAYEAEEHEMIKLFESPDQAPFFGSYHLLVASIIFPREFDISLKKGVSFKDLYPQLYKQVKNGDFAVQYGAMEESGTADRAYGVPNAQRIIQSRFVNIKRLGDVQIRHANEYGYVWTMPDRTIGNRGYPLQIGRNHWGKIKPTMPLNYHVQGSAMWCTRKAMVRVYEYLKNNPEYNSFLRMQIHDELVVDMPLADSKPKLDKNQRLAKRISQLMQQSGTDLGVPLSASMTRHTNNWSEGEEQTK